MEINYAWRTDLTDAQLVALTEAHGGDAEPGWWDRARQHSLGWVSAHDGDQLVGFANLAWDGAGHAFLLDPKVHADWQHRGIGTELVRRARDAARDADCEWLHVDFEPRLRPFYFGACGFTSTDAGLIRLTAS